MWYTLFAGRYKHMTDSEKLNKLLETVVQMQGRFDKMDERLDKMDERFDKMDNRLEVMEVRQNKMHEQLTELQLSQKLFELNTNKKLARLQDGLDTVEEILKMNELIPQ